MLSQSSGQNPYSPSPEDTLSSLLDPNNPPSAHSSSKKTSRWTLEEDDLLRKYSLLYGERQWRKVSQKIPGKTSIQCLHRWTKILKPGLVKGAWTAEEDQKLYAWVNANGPNKWSQAAKLIQGRSGKQCRERWFNNLSPDVKKTEWTKEEDELISKLYQQYGSSWSQLAKFIPGRTENSIKNRFYSTLRRMATIKKKKSRGASLMAHESHVKEEEQEDGDSDDKSQLYIPENIQPSGPFMFGGASSLDDLMKESMIQNNCKGAVINREMTPDKKMLIKRDQTRITPEKRLFEEIEENGNSKTRYSSGTKRNTVEESDRDFDNFLALDGFEMMSPVLFGEYSSKAAEKSLETDVGTDVDTSHLCSKQNSKVASDEIYTSMPLFLSPIKPSHTLQPPAQNYGQGYDSNNMQKMSPPQTGYGQMEAKPNEMTPPRHYAQNSEHMAAKTNNANLDNTFLMLPQRIIEECSSQHVDGVQRVLNLIALLKIFSGQNVQAINVMCQNFSPNVLKEFLMNMQKAISSTSTVHCNYIKHLLSIARDMPINNVEEVNSRMHYLYVQLSSLETLVENVRELINKLGAFAHVNNQLPVYGNYKENMNTNHGIDPMYKNEFYKPNAITIRIGTLNSGLEEISKKRAVN